MSGDVALVGAPGVNEQAGAVYVFRRVGGAWTDSGMLPAEGIVAGDAFGAALAMNGEMAMVGAPTRDNRTGAVFAFDVSGASLVAAGELPLPGVARNDRFGSSILLGDGVVGVGAIGANGGAGVAHAFAMTDEGWELTVTVGAFDPSPRAAFGAAMAFVGDEVWISAPTANRGSGAVYAFRMVGDEVAGVDKVLAEALSGRVQAGGAIASGDGFVAVATPGADSGAGSVVFFDQPADTWMAAAVVQSAPEGFDPVRGEEVG